MSTTLTALKQGSSVADVPAVSMGFGNLQSFELMQRVAKMLSSSTLVPAAYRAFDDKKGENPSALPNCIVALNMSERMKADPLMVMQNLHIIEGRPSWSSQWIMASINGCGRFTPLRFDLSDQGEKEVEYTSVSWQNRERVVKTNKATIKNTVCVAWAIEKETGERVESPPISMEMAVKEGWYGKSGSKWQTMPEVMLRYRAASFFGRIYAPELLMGLTSVEEAQDMVLESTIQDGKVIVDLGDLRQPSDAEEVVITPPQKQKEVPTETAQVTPSATPETAKKPPKTSKTEPIAEPENLAEAVPQEDVKTDQADDLYQAHCKKLRDAKTVDALDVAMDLTGDLEALDVKLYASLTKVYESRRQFLANQQDTGEMFE